jgi:hypothetical protein
MFGRMKSRSRLVIGSKVSTVTIFTLAIALVGCSDVFEQENLAVTAAKRFQTIYNNGSCEQLYTDASQYFRRHETSVRWSRDCVQLRTRFGRCTDFKPELTNVYPFGGIGIVYIQGPAQFEKSEAQLRLDWDITNSHATLNNILIEAKGEQIAIPGFTGEVRE